jgi:superfamily II DNA or RNA helicase
MEQDRDQDQDQEEKESIILQPHQDEWGHRILDIISSNHGYIDTSRMGSGKTYVTLWIAKQCNIPILIICPVIMKSVWSDTADEFDINVIDVISYQKLRSKKRYIPKHGLLERYDQVTEGGITHTQFSATQKLIDIVDQGVLIIFDEIQNIKNNSDQYKACNILIKTILTRATKSRYALLSGTPLDKEEQSINLLKMMGFIQSTKLYSYNASTKKIKLEGIAELITACSYINKTETSKIIKQTPPTKDNMISLAYLLYTKIVKFSISGSMPSPDIPFAQDIKNGFYNISRDNEIRLQNALKTLTNAFKRGHIIEEETGKKKTKNQGVITKLLLIIENSKVEDMVRVCREILSTENNKVIISLNFTSSINKAYDLLDDLNPLILNGQTPVKDRKTIVKQFNKDPTVRLLIMNTVVGGVGISLHDTDGRYPRHMIISPSYKMIDIIQATGRIYRYGTKSDATVRIFYGKASAGKEIKILQAMGEKSRVLKGTLDEENTENLVLPGDYPTYEEKTTTNMNTVGKLVPVKEVNLLKTIQEEEERKNPPKKRKPRKK